MAKYNERGEEMENKEPVEMPLKFKRPPSIHELIAQAVRTEAWAAKMEREGKETFEEANDFDVGDDVEPDSRYEVQDDAEFHYAEQEWLDKAQKEMDNIRAVNEDRKRRENGTESSEAGDGREGTGKRGEKRSEVGGEGRSTAGRGRRVSEVRRGSDYVDKGSSGGDDEVDR